LKTSSAVSDPTEDESGERDSAMLRFRLGHWAMRRQNQMSWRSAATHAPWELLADRDSNPWA
jgi:hypothetical protein